MTGTVEAVVFGVGSGGLANAGLMELWKPSAGVTFWTVEGVGRSMEVEFASLVAVSWEGGAANSLLKSPWPVAIDLLGE